MKKLQKGFTLIELLIVIIILAILIAIVVGVAFQSNRNKAYDIDKKSDVSTLQKKLEEYFVDNNAYPGALTDLTSGTDPYLTALPTNPAGTSYSYSATPASCSGAACTGYILSVQLSNQREAITGNVETCPSGAGTGKCYVVRSSQ